MTVMLMALSDRRRVWATTGLLAIFSLISYLDRQVLAVLVPDLRRDLAITDIQFGWLIGPVFFAVYVLALGLVSAFVDRGNRKWIIALGVVVWSVLTIASGFAQSFTQLIVLRGGVAFGEALLGPAAISLIGDMFSRNDRPLPTAVYVAGSTVGATGSILISAFVLHLASLITVTLPVLGAAEAWRLTLIAVGIPGLVLTPVFLLLAREPRRNAAGAVNTTVSAWNAGPHLRVHGLFYLGAFSALALFVMNMGSIALWGPTYFIRAFDLEPVIAGYLIGGASLVGGLAGTLILPALIRPLIAKGQTDAALNLVLATMGLAIVAALIGGFSASLPLALIGLGGFLFMAAGAATMPTLMVQIYVPARLRGRASGFVFFSIYLFAFGLAPILVPAVAEQIFSGQAAIGRAIAIVVAVSGAAACALLAALRQGFHRAEKEALRLEHGEP